MRIYIFSISSFAFKKNILKSENELSSDESGKNTGVSSTISSPSIIHDSKWSNIFSPHMDNRSEVGSTTSSTRSSRSNSISNNEPFVLISGWLQKKEPTNSQRKRFFKLNEGSKFLLYYKTDV